MFVIFGTKMRKKVYGEIGTSENGCCDAGETAKLLITYRRWFTLFFIPTFPVGSKKYYMMCSHCEALYNINKEKAEELLHSMPA